MITWKKELKPFTELLAALLLSFILVLGTIYNIFKPFWDYRKVSFQKILELTWNWYKDMTIQIVNVIFYFIWHIFKSIYMCFSLKFWRAIKHIVHEFARSLDLLGNVLAGELIEDIITPVEKTYFGLGEITISAATGYIVRLSLFDSTKMNKTGHWLSNTLNKAFNEKEHALWSWEREIKNHKLYGREDYFELI